MAPLKINDDGSVTIPGDLLVQGKAEFGGEVSVPEYGLNANSLTSQGVVSGGWVFVRNVAEAPAPSPSEGCLWNNDGVLYWVTGSKRVMLADGR